MAQAHVLKHLSCLGGLGADHEGGAAGSQLPRRHSSLLLSQILSEFHEDEDQSVYGLMNAVAAVARDEDDPETKWDLEELAGWVPMLVPSNQTCHDTAEVAAVS